MKASMLNLSIDRTSRGSLQSKLREGITQAIVAGDFDAAEPLPSTRMLAHQLGVSRNTVTQVYQDLTVEGLLLAKGRKGHFVVPGLRKVSLDSSLRFADSCIDWQSRLVTHASSMSFITHPPDWRTKRYTFAYGQHDRWMFPIADWRRCSRESLSRDDIHDWTVDYVDADDPLLLEAFRHRVVPRRMFRAGQSNVLVTVGAQHALYLAAQCLVRPGTVVGVEEPGYPDVRNIFQLFGAILRPLPVDTDGLVVDRNLRGCDLVYVTPSHQSPTTVTMSEPRRWALLDMARQEDFIIIEDDYDTETRFGRDFAPALKAKDTEGRVVYMTSLSKLLSPGLRVGFLVGPEPFIREARSLRRLGIRHPAANNQRTVALFLKGGYYEALLRQYHNEYERRWNTLHAALERFIPESTVTPSHGGSSIWLCMPRDVDTVALARRAYLLGVHIEESDVHFYNRPSICNFLRLGISSIKAEDITEGVRLLAEALGNR